MRRGRCLAHGQHGQSPVVHQKGLLVVFCMIADYPGATSRHYSFMRKGLEELQGKLNHCNIGFRMLEQSPEAILPRFLEKIDAHLLVSDFDPLRIKQQWKKKLINSLRVPLHEVDTHNIVPAWIISEKKEYATYTLNGQCAPVVQTSH